MVGNHAVASGENIFAIGSHATIDCDRPFRADRNACRSGKGNIRSYADNHEHEVGEQSLLCSIGSDTVDL